MRTDADDAGKADMNRLYVVETALSNTGAKADHRLALRAGEIEAFARRLAAELGVPACRGRRGTRRWPKQVAADVANDPAETRSRAAGSTLVVAGDRSRPPSICWPTRSTNSSATSARP